MPRERVRRVAGGTVGWRERLKGDGPTVVLIHGAAATHRVFDPLWPHLGDVRALAPSLPGRGGSSGPPLATVAEMAAWLGEVLAELAPGPVVLAGHSLGGAVALELALAAPPAGLALLATGARLRVHPTLLALYERAARARRRVPTLPFGWEPDTPREVLLAWDAAVAPTPPGTALADWHAADAFDRLGALGALGVPALVLGGDRDALTPPRYGDYLAQHLPGAHRVCLPGAGHFLVASRAREVADALVRFVRAL